MFRPAYSSDDYNQTAYNALRHGTVTATRMGSNGPEVQVEYADRGVTSDWTPIGNQGAGGAVSFWCPRVGTAVTVAHFGTGIEQGIVLCSNPTDNGGSIIPSSINSIAMMADDGAQFEYCPDTGLLTILGVTKISIAASGDTVIYSGGNLTAKVGGNVVATVGGNLNATVSGSLTANITGSATITAPTINLNGNTKITGTLECTGFFTADVGGTTLTGHITNADGAGGGA